MNTYSTEDTGRTCQLAEHGSARGLHGASVTGDGVLEVTVNGEGDGEGQGQGGGQGRRGGQGDGQGLAAGSPWCPTAHRGTSPGVPRYAVRTARTRLVRVRCTYSSRAPGQAALRLRYVQDACGMLQDVRVSLARHGCEAQHGSEACHNGERLDSAVFWATESTHGLWLRRLRS